MPQGTFGNNKRPCHLSGNGDPGLEQRQMIAYLVCQVDGLRLHGLSPQPLLALSAVVGILRWASTGQVLLQQFIAYPIRAQSL